MALAQTLARRKVYYGWYIVAVAFTINVITLGFNSYAPAVFLKPMTENCIGAAAFGPWR